jgi:hypothetical protein
VKLSLKFVVFPSSSCRDYFEGVDTRAGKFYRSKFFFLECSVVTSCISFPLRDKVFPKLFDSPQFKAGLVPPPLELPEVMLLASAACVEPDAPLTDSLLIEGPSNSPKFFGMSAQALPSEI